MNILSVLPFVPVADTAPAASPHNSDSPSDFDALVNEADDAPAPARPKQDRRSAQHDDSEAPAPQSSTEAPTTPAKTSESEPKTAASTEEPATADQADATAPAAQTATADDGAAPIAAPTLGGSALPAAAAQAAATAPSGAPATQSAQNTAPVIAPVVAGAAPTPASNMPASTAPAAPVTPDAAAAKTQTATPETAQAPVAPTAPNAQAIPTNPAAAQAAAATVAKATPETAAPSPRADRDVAKTAKTGEGAKNAASAATADPAATAGKNAAPSADAAVVKTTATAERPVVSVQDQALPADAANAAHQTSGDGSAIDAADAGGLRRSESAHAAQAPERAAHRGQVIDLASLATRFAARVQNGSTQFSIRLDPAELGRVDVQLEVSADGVAHARLVAERPEALAELTRHARALERELADAGVDLSRGGLSFELASRDGGEARERGYGSAEGRAAASVEDVADVPMETAGALAEIDSAYGFSVLRRGRLDVRI